jgi:transcriptional regulator with XRE-family HTH domain
MVSITNSDGAQSLDTPRSLRVRLGLRASDIAKRARVASRTVCEIEQGRDVRLESLRAVAAALEVDAAVLLHSMERQAAMKKSAPLFRPRTHKRAGGGKW